MTEPVPPFHLQAVRVDQDKHTIFLTGIYEDANGDTFHIRHRGSFNFEARPGTGEDEDGEMLLVLPPEKDHPRKKPAPKEELFVYYLTVRHFGDVGYNDTHHLIGAFASLEAAINAAEIHAEEEFGVDDVQFDFPVEYQHAKSGAKMRGQFYPADRPNPSNLDPEGPWQAAYAIERILVKQEA